MRTFLDEVHTIQIHKLVISISELFTDNPLQIHTHADGARLLSLEKYTHSSGVRHLFFYLRAASHEDSFQTSTTSRVTSGSASTSTGSVITAVEAPAGV